MPSSGTAAKATTDDNPVDVLTTRRGDKKLFVVNEGSAPGFIQIGADDDWRRIPAGPTSRHYDISNLTDAVTVKAKRVAGGTNMSGVYADSLERRRGQTQSDERDVRRC